MKMSEGYKPKVSKRPKRSEALNSMSEESRPRESREEMINCKVHNVGFYKPEARAIHCMAYAYTCNKLSVSRVDSSIEIWDCRHALFIERTIPATTGGSVEAMAWYNDRLFGVGLHGVVVEYNLLTLSIKYEVSVTSGPAWCIDIHEAEKLLAVGTEDGYINIFEIEDDRLNYVKLLDKQEGRILCLKWDHTGDVIVTGSSDSLRLWNVGSGHAIHRMQTGRSTRNKETIVWCVAITRDMTIISGDSRGCLTFWNGEMGLQIQMTQTLMADILCLSLSSDQNTVYCSGVDTVIANFNYMPATKDSAQCWVRGNNRMIHRHDVRALICAGRNLISGGVDSYLACSQTGKVVWRYPPILQAPCVVLCPKSRCVLLRYPSHVEVWRLGAAMPAADITEGVLPLHQEPLKLLKLTAKGQEPITCASISQDSNWLAYSTATHVRFFSFTLTDERPIIEKLTYTSGDCGPAHMIQFAPSSQYLVMASKLGDFHVVHMSNTEATLLHSFRPYADKLLNDAVKLMTFSPDGKYLVAADLKSNVVVWETDSWKHYCSLPHVQSVPMAMAVQPVTNNLVVVDSDNKMIEFCLSPEEKKYTAFSRQLADSCCMPISHKVTNIAFVPDNQDVIVMSSYGGVIIVNKKMWLDLSSVPGKKQPKMSGVHGRFKMPSDAYRFIKKYKYLVYLGWLENDEMVAVEVSPLSLEENLPPALRKKKFGMW